MWLGYDTRAFLVQLLFLLLLPQVGLGREFTDKFGRTMEAEIVAAVGSEKVVISRDGEEITVGIDLFSSVDQEYLRGWIRDNPGAVRLDIKLAPYLRSDRGDKKMVKVDYDEKVEIQPSHYEVSLNNVGDGTVENLKLDYIIFIDDRVQDPAGANGSTYHAPYKKLIRITGAAEIDKIDPHSRRMALLPSFDIHNYVDRDGGRTDLQKKDILLGLWLRLSKGGKVVAEKKLDADGGPGLAGMVWKGGGKSPGGTAMGSELVSWLENTEWELRHDDGTRRMLRFRPGGKIALKNGLSWEPSVKQFNHRYKGASSTSVTYGQKNYLAQFDEGRQSFEFNAKGDTGKATFVRRLN